MNKVDFSQIKMYDEKTYDQLLKQIHKNSIKRDNQINKLIEDLSGLVKDSDDANLLTPLIVDYVNAGIKNDDQLVKLANVIQRFIKTDTGSDIDLTEITDRERDELEAISREIQSSGKVVKMG